MTRLVAAALLVAGLAGCAGPATSTSSRARFADRAILWRYPDDAPIPMPPARPEPSSSWEGVRDAVFRPARRWLALEPSREAGNVNALDELPDSTWFVDRRRDPTAPDDQPRWVPLAPEVAERGAAEPGSEPVPPLTVVEGKTIGSAAGFVATDARGVRYVIKLDPPHRPGLVTSTEVVASRLAWLAGWIVPAEMLVDLAPERDVRLGPKAFTRDSWRKKIPFTEEMLRRMLVVSRRPDGRVRVLASRWIEGKSNAPIGYLGLDRHDANDRVLHQDRRDLRGFGVWAAWVDDVDTFDNNLFDSYVGAPGAGHVVHYQQDVGGSFGVFAARVAPYWMGQETYLAPGRILASLLTLGAARRPWTGRPFLDAGDELVTTWPELGFFDAQHFDPRRWKPVLDNPAFVRQTPRDRYWGAKQIVRLTSDEVRAAIRAGGYRPEAAEHLFAVLWQRRQRIARDAFTPVSPLDHFRLDGERIWFEDLWLTAGLGAAPGTSYQARELTAGGRPILVAASAPYVTLPRREGYRIVELRAQRPGTRNPAPPVRVHLIDRGPTRHILGIER